MNRQILPPQIDSFIKDKMNPMHCLISYAHVMQKAIARNNVPIVEVKMSDVLDSEEILGAICVSELGLRANMNPGPTLVFGVDNIDMSALNGMVKVCTGEYSGTFRNMYILRGNPVLYISNDRDEPSDYQLCLKVPLRRLIMDVDFRNVYMPMIEVECKQAYTVLEYILTALKPV